MPAARLKTRAGMKILRFSPFAGKAGDAGIESQGSCVFLIFLPQVFLTRRIPANAAAFAGAFFQKFRIKRLRACLGYAKTQPVLLPPPRHTGLPPSGGRRIGHAARPRSKKSMRVHETGRRPGTHMRIVFKQSVKTAFQRYAGRRPARCPKNPGAAVPRKRGRSPPASAPHRP